MINRKLVGVSALLVIWSFLIAFPLVAKADPVGLLNSIANQLISALKAQRATLKSNPGLVYSLAYRIVVPHADVNEMAQRVLPPRIWNSATPAERAIFKKEFTSLLVRTYASALAEYTDQTVKFYPPRGNNGRDVQVNSTIYRSDGPSISVEYRLVNRGSWKLYDMIVEGVSMLESFRSQFADELSQGSMASLIQRLRQHNGG